LLDFDKLSFSLKNNTNLFLLYTFVTLITLIKYILSLEQEEESLDVVKMDF